MPTVFVATQISVVQQHDVLVTTLSATPIEDEELYLTLQHKDAYDAQDVKFGMDQPYIEFCGQGWSWYGHILSFELGPNRIRVKMDEAAADRMNNDGLLEVTFRATPVELMSLRSALARTFRSCRYYADQC